MGWKSEWCVSNLGYFQKLRKWRKNNRKNIILQTSKVSAVQRGFKRNQRGNSAVQRCFIALKIFVHQRCTRIETLLNQSWPVLISSETSTKGYEIQFLGLPPYKKQGNHRKPCMVIYEYIKGIKSTVEVYGNMQVIKRAYYNMIPWKSYTVP